VKQMSKPSMYDWVAHLDPMELREYLMAQRMAKNAKECPHCVMAKLTNRAVQRARLKVKEGKEARQ
jgi:hypothetical protein